MAGEKKQPKAVNPFDKGVSYEKFLQSIPEGLSVVEHCKTSLPELSADQVEWLDVEIQHFKNNQTK